MRQPKNKTIFLACVLSIILLGALLGGHADAAGLKLNVDYPNIPAPGGAFDLNCIETKACDPTIGNIILFVFYAALWIGGIVAFVSLIYAGFQFIIAGENPSVRAAARERLENVMWGIVILLLTVLVLNVINPALTKLNEPTLKGVGCAQWDGQKTKCENNSDECVWKSGDKCKERIEDLGFPEPGDDGKDGNPGKFACWLSAGGKGIIKCRVYEAQSNCSKGYAPDASFCLDTSNNDCLLLPRTPCVKEP